MPKILVDACPPGPALDAAVARVLGLEVLGTVACYGDPECDRYVIPYDGYYTGIGAVECQVYLAHCVCEFREEWDADYFGHIAGCLEIVAGYSKDVTAAMELAGWVFAHTNYEYCSSYIKHAYVQFRFHAHRYNEAGTWPPVPVGETHTIAGEAKPNLKLDQNGVTVLPLAITRAFLKANGVEEIEVPEP